MPVIVSKKVVGLNYLVKVLKEIVTNDNRTPKILLSLYRNLEFLTKWQRSRVVVTSVRACNDIVDKIVKISCRDLEPMVDNMGFVTIYL